MQFARKIVLLSAVVMMGAAGGAAAKENDLTNATKPVSVVTVEGMTEYRLPNGLRVVLYPDMSKPTATVNMTYLVGSRHENYGETGMAHLLAVCKLSSLCWQAIVASCSSFAWS